MTAKKGQIVEYREHGFMPPKVIRAGEPGTFYYVSRSGHLMRARSAELILENSETCYGAVANGADGYAEFFKFGADGEAKKIDFVPPGIKIIQ